MSTIAARSMSWRGSILRRSPSGLRGGRGSRRRQFQDTPNWEQYREVFEAILCSNGWDDVTAALQLVDPFLHASTRSAKLYDFAPDIQDAIELWVLRPHARLVKVISVWKSRGNPDDDSE